MKAELPSSIIASHWSGVTRYIWDYPLQRAVFLLNSRSSLFCDILDNANPPRRDGFGSYHKTLFIPKLQSQFAEFLKWSFLDHLSILMLDHLFRLRYGIMLSVFLELEAETFFIQYKKVSGLKLSARKQTRNFISPCWKQGLGVKPFYSQAFTCFTST